MREVVLKILFACCLVAGINSSTAQESTYWVRQFSANGPGPEEINFDEVFESLNGDFAVLILRKDRQLGSDVAFPLHCVNGFDSEMLSVFAVEYDGENPRLAIREDKRQVYQTEYWKQTRFFVFDFSEDKVLDDLKNQLQVKECREWSTSGGYEVYENISLGFIDESQSDLRASYEEQVCWRIKNAIDILNREAEKRSASKTMFEAIERANSPKFKGRFMAGVRKSLIDSYSAANSMTMQSTKSPFNFEFTASMRMKGKEDGSSIGIEVAPSDAVFETNWTPTEQSMPWNQDGVDGGVFFVEHNGVKEQVGLDFLAVSGLWLKPVNIPKFNDSNVILRFGVPLLKRQFSELTEGEFSYSASVPGVENRIRNVESMGLVDDVVVDPTWQTDLEFGGWLAGATLQVINGLGDDSSYYLSTSMDIHRWNISDSSMPIASISPTQYSSAMAGTSVGLVNLRVAAGIIFGR